MGYYIQTPGNHNKADQIIDLYGGIPVSQPRAFSKSSSIPICVVQNGLFDAAAIIHNQREFDDFTDPDDLRHKDWLLMDRDKVLELVPDAPV